jgi:hypothetical protein
MIKLIFISIVVLISEGSIFSQNNNVVDISFSSIQDTTNKNYYTVFINIDIKKGWHLNSNRPLDEYLTPTTVKLKDTSGIMINNIEYPPETITKLQFSDSDLSLYEGMITIKVHLLVNDDFLKNNKKVELDLEYQSCNNQTCLFPTEKTLVIGI